MSDENKKTKKSFREVCAQARKNKNKKAKEPKTEGKEEKTEGKEEDKEE